MKGRSWDGSKIKVVRGKWESDGGYVALSDVSEAQLRKDSRSNPGNPSVIRATCCHINYLYMMWSTVFTLPDLDMI